MIQVNIPNQYTPNLTVFYWVARKRWVLDYELPSTDGQIKTRLSLPNGCGIGHLGYCNSAAGW